MDDEKRSGGPSEFPKAPPRKPVVKIDNFVRKHTQAVEVEKLNQMGLTTINFISLSKINQLISLAVLKAFEKYQRIWNQNEALKIQEEVRAEIDKQILRKQAGQEVLAEQQRSLGEDVKKLRPAIESRVQELAVEKQGEIGRWSILCSEEGFDELEKLMRGFVAEAVQEAARRIEKTAGANFDLEKLESLLQGVVRRVLEGERRRIQQESAQSSDQKTEILERRLDKLKIHLAEMEETLKEMAEAKGIDPGLPSFFKDLQGLRLDERQFEKKKGMLKAIFEDNLKLQGIACIEE